MRIRCDIKISKMEQLHFYLKFQAEMVLVTFAETKVTPAAGEQFEDKVKGKFISLET